MSDILKRINEIGVLPVIKIDDVADAVPLANALANGGLPLAEITFRTDAAEASIKEIAKNCPNVLLGAGTILTSDQADRAMGAGAKFLVSPGFNPAVVEYCLKKGYPITPGVNNPSLVEQASSMGLDVLKFFPAEQSGGLDMLKTFSAVYSKLKFIPTGGITPKNLASYAKTSNVFATGGTWLVTEALLAKKDFATITNLAKEAVAILHGFCVGHVGINCDTTDNAKSVSGILAMLFDMKITDGNTSTFVANADGNQFEMMKNPYYGKNGHIAIKCNNILRAEAYLKGKGIAFIEETRNGKALYFKDEIGGFALHLLQA